MAGERPSRAGVAYSGGSRLAVPFPTDDPDDAERVDQDDDQEPDDPADDDDAAGDEVDGDQSGGRRSVSLPGGGGLAGAGAGWVLGMLIWGWIVLPFFKGGPGQVKNTLRAKFINQAPDGSPLP